MSVNSGQQESISLPPSPRANSQQQTREIPSSGEPVVVQIVYQIAQQPQLVYPSGDARDTAPYHTYAVPQVGEANINVPAHTVTVPNPALLVGPIGEGRSASNVQQREVSNSYSQTTAPSTDHTGSQVQHPQVQHPQVRITTAAQAVALKQTGSSQPYALDRPRTAQRRWKPSVDSALFALFLLIPALMLMLSALGHGPFSSHFDDLYLSPALNFPTSEVRLPPRVLLFSVETCSYNRKDHTTCDRLSFSDAKDQKLVSDACVGYVEGTTGMVFVSICAIPLCIFFAIREVQKKEVFSFSVPLVAVLALLFTGLSFGLPMSAIERKVCAWNATKHNHSSFEVGPYNFNFPGKEDETTYQSGTVVTVALLSHTLLWVVLLGYIPRLCRWSCCILSKPSDASRRRWANSGTITGDADADPIEEDVPAELYTRVLTLAWMFICVGLLAAALATPVLSGADTQDYKMYLWLADDCRAAPCEAHSIGSATGHMCKSHVSGAAAMAIIALVSLIGGVLVQVNELRRKFLFPFAPLGIGLFSCVCCWASYGILDTAAARRYCMPYTVRTGGHSLLVAAMSMLLCLPVFQVHWLFPLLFCENEPYDDEELPEKESSEGKDSTEHEVVIAPEVERMTENEQNYTPSHDNGDLDVHREYPGVPDEASTL